MVFELKSQREETPVNFACPSNVDTGTSTAYESKLFVKQLCFLSIFFLLELSRQSTLVAVGVIRLCQ